MAEPLRVLHYINAFFGGLGGEEEAHTAVSLQDGASGREGSWSRSWPMRDR